MKLLQKIGVENIDFVTLLADSDNPGYNRGFAFLELETYRDAQIAYRKLSSKDVFGKGSNIRVDWAEPLNGSDEKQMQKVSLSLSHTHTHARTHACARAHAHKHLKFVPQIYGIGDIFGRNAFS